MKIRSITDHDTQAVLDIYAPYIEDSSISFETVVPTADEFKNRIQETTAQYPWLVYETAGEILGYAYACAHRTRAAYAWSVDSAIYVSRPHLGQGIGKSLYQALLPLLKTQGVANVYAGITLPNAPSVGLHESCGFTLVGIYKDVGFKQGRWWDVGWWQLPLSRPDQPMPLKPPSRL